MQNDFAAYIVTDFVARTFSEAGQREKVIFEGNTGDLQGKISWSVLAPESFWDPLSRRD